MSDKKYLREFIENIITKKAEQSEISFREFLLPKAQEILGLNEAKEKCEDETESDEDDEDVSKKFLKNRDNKTDKPKVKKMKVEETTKK